MPAEVGDCAALGSAEARDACWAGVAAELFRDDPAAASGLVEERIADPLVRDYVYLEVTREGDPAGGRWCERISAPVVAERCRQLVQRPHLQRDRIEPRSGDAGATAP